MNDRERRSVVVVGAGPAGLATAITLARQGIDCLVVERRSALSSLPRATVVSTRSMELMRSWGLEGELRAGGDAAEWKLLECETLAQAADGVAFAVGYPTTEQAELISPTSPACVPQDHLERVLLRHLATLPSARVELGLELTDLQAGPDGVRVALHEQKTGRVRLVESGYLVAADGARSSVRRALGIAMQGPDHLGDSLTVLFRAPLWELVGPHRYGIYSITHPDAAGTFLPAGQGDRWLYGVHRQPGTRPFDLRTEGELVGLIRLAAGAPSLQPRIERTGTFAFAAQIADRFRDGNVFLIGDAAHRATPRGGTGMNSAIADGVDLGWKLAWRLQGWATASILDTYEAERRPIVEHHLARSIDPMGSRRGVIDELQADLAGRITHAWLAGGTSRTSTVDLIGPGLTLFTGPDGAAWERAAASVGAGVPVVVGRLDHLASRAIGIRAGGALLARPDGAPVGSWPAPADPVANLRRAVNEAALVSRSCAPAR